MSKKVTAVLMVLGITLGFAVIIYATVPPPVVNQQAGIDDGIFNNLVAADCRVCHDQGGGPVDGICSESGDSCTVDPDGGQSDCPNANDECLPILAKNRHHLLVDSGIPGGTLLSRPEISPPAWTDDANNDGNADTNYACENCHPDDPDTPIIEFPVTRNCLVCHEQQPGVGSVHHIAATSPAQQDPPLCTPCHGDLVDDTSDGHTIPTYDASLITPKTSQGNGPAGDPNNPNLANFGATNRGACDYCHSTGNRHGQCSSDPTEECSLAFVPNGGDCDTPNDSCLPDSGGSHDPENPGIDIDPGPPVVETMVYGPSVVHHNTGLGNFAGGANDPSCELCHPPSTAILIGDCSLTGTACTSDAQCAPGETCNFVEEIRTCEGCHGYEALHNIALDSDGDGFLNVGAEDPWYSHVGNSQDCEGCHRGYGAASAPGTGPITPVLNGADATTVLAGTDAVITLDGKAFTNTTEGTTYTSNVVMTAGDGSSVTLTPSAITQSSMTVTIPGTTAAGNYELRAAKAPGSESNPLVISVIPGVSIADVTCRGNKKRGYELTIMGAGFGDAPPAGSGDYLNVALNGVVLDDTTTWADTEITAGVSRCPSTSLVNVNALFGSDTAQATTGKIKKPKK